ncbi:hypothetical protein E2C01_066511 [Portunus trituberculatus]|uniref:Uncharacterized protein n=1 Tax=Portunus trituberculatus TaxID=210409 RepID=A0A5B7HLQ2_PORTR|nr:hypothetical protein [Portunus trituberculatus]
MLLAGRVGHRDERPPARQMHNWRRWLSGRGVGRFRLDHWFLGRLWATYARRDARLFLRCFAACRLGSAVTPRPTRCAPHCTATRWDRVHMIDEARLALCTSPYVPMYTRRHCSGTEGCLLNDYLLFEKGSLTGSYQRTE